MDEYQGNFFKGRITDTITFVLLLCSAFIAVVLWRTRRSKLKLPPGPWGLPVVGYLPFLAKESFRTFDNLRKKYGNIFGLYLGSTYVVILGDYGVVKEAFSKWETTDRPPDLFGFIPNGIGLPCLNGSEWVEQRKFIVRVLKNLASVESAWENLIEEELSAFLKLLRSHGGRPINIFKLLTASISNNISSFVLGKQLPFGDPNHKFLHEGLNDLMEVISLTGVYTYFPWLVRLMEKLNIGGYTESSAKAVYFNNFIRKEAELHQTAEKVSRKGFVHRYLEEIKIQQKIDPLTTFNEGNLIGNIKGLYIGGSDTIFTSLSWLMVAMASHPDIQEKVHSELDSVLGEGQRASWEDRFHFPYTYAVVMENTRWKTIIPLNTSHVAKENFRLGGFDIQKGTTIIANNWGIHNNPIYWKDPEKFIPERFLLNEGRKVNLWPENYTPFSYGKRFCPGVAMAMTEMFLYFTSIMQFFEVRSPSGVKPCLDGIMGMVYAPAPQEICFLARSPETKAG